MLVQRSLQPPPLPALRVVGGHVALALPRHFEAGFFQRGADVGSIAHDTVLEALHQVVRDDLARVGLDRHSGPQPRRIGVGAVAGLVRPASAVLVVEGVAQRPEGLLPAGGRDVHALAGFQVAPAGKDVLVHAAAPLTIRRF